jgi:hypothetical protein
MMMRSTKSPYLLLRDPCMKSTRSGAQFVPICMPDIRNMLSIKNSSMMNFWKDQSFVAHIELEIKDTTDTARSASYLGLMLDINSEKEKDFNFPIVNFPFICSNTPTVRAYGVYISQLIRYLRTSFQNVLDRGMLLTRKQFQLAKL